ncbi:hypothetical protein B0H16DRAFT_1890506 [Mycena metata]|uniref:F-box domain-containing protein n=1 Tax=Mycena metata TaxID=1033252 RepID=A0AAD7IEK2_9AGAR|nr:hypothetical protein B0H16DRAFT_1890506 [Mycena metata]
MSFGPFALHLGTNYCPTDEEASDIKSFLVEPGLRLRRLDDKIAELQNELDKLAAERESLVVYIDGHKALISPLRRLPLDIVQEIFLACIPTHRNCVMSALEAPVLLGRICSSWRAISLSIPRLWSRLHIIEPQRSYGADLALSDIKAAQRFAVTKMWLGRSGNCPLSISLLCRAEETHIDLTLSPVALDFVGQLTATDVPLLQSVRLQYDYPVSDRRTMDLANFGMLRGPRISSFCGFGYDIIDFGEKLPLQWHQLTLLAMTTLGAWQTSLTSWSVLQILQNGIPSLTPVELNSLNTTEVGCEVVESTLSRLLDRLSLPNLRNFTLYGPASVSESPPSLAKCFARWSRLESVTISSNSFAKSSLLASIRSLPDTVQHLKIYDITNRSLPGVPSATSLDDSALAILTPTDGLPLQCPVLESFDLESCIDVSDEAILRFITARMSDPSGARLKRVTLTFNRLMTLDILPSIQPFIDAGLNISIKHFVPYKAQFSPWQGLDDAPESPTPWRCTA